MAPIRLPSPIEEPFAVQKPSKQNGNAKQLVGQVQDVVHKETFDVKETELHAPKKSKNVNFEDFYGLRPTRVDRRFDVTLSDHSYLPKVSCIETNSSAFEANHSFRSKTHVPTGSSQPQPMHLEHTRAANWAMSSVSQPLAQALALTSSPLLTSSQISKPWL